MNGIRRQKVRSQIQQSDTRTSSLIVSVMIILDHLSVRCLMIEEEYHSLKETYKLLCDILDPKKTPRVPKPVRDKARHCLKYFPVRRTLKELEGGVGFFNPR